MINSPTLIDTIDAALETAQIITNIMADAELTYKERYDLIDALLAAPQAEAAQMTEKG